MASLNRRSPADVRPSAAPQANDLTYVELLHIKDQAQRWIRFGRVVHEQIIDRRRKLVAFAPGSVFAIVRWSANDYGTVVSRLHILRAVGADEAFTAVPDVDPGGELLARISGWPKVKRAFEAIDAVETLGLAPEDACPDHWRQVGSRLAAGLRPEPYRRDRHQAWRARVELGR